MKRKTITEAAIEALNMKGVSMNAKEIYDTIIDQELYIFKAQNPFNVLKSELRKHSKVGQDQLKSLKQYFILQDTGYYSLVK
jgi:hypothetical protein